jgi:hypothetical protein
VVNNASPTFPKNFRSALETFDVNEDGLIDYNEFLEMERRFPMILFPAFRLQDRMQKLTLGEGAWLKIMEYVHKHKKIEEYKATHGGKMPPEDLLTTVMRVVMPCLFSPIAHHVAPIAVGGALEDRHRKEEGEKKKKKKSKKDAEKDKEAKEGEE